MSQISEKMEKRIRAIMYIAVFLTVFVSLAVANIGLERPLVIVIFSLAMALIFLFLVLEYAPPKEVKKLTFVVGLGIVLGLIAASRSINIVSILASILGFAIAAAYHKYSNKLFDGLLKIIGMHD